MKNTIRTILLAILVVTLLWPTTAFAKDPFDDRVVFGGTFTLESGETQQGSLVVFGGAVTTEPDSVVNGDLVLIGGTVDVGGTVNGSVVGIGGAVRLDGSANINGDVFTLGATLRREEGASISGQVINGIETPLVTEDAQGSAQIPDAPPAPQVTVDTNPFLEMIWFFFRTFLYTALAVLLVMFLPNPVKRVSRAAVSQPVITAGAGLLTTILAPIALVAITLTLVLIPVTFLTIVLIFAAWLLGWVALGLEAGSRIGKALKLDWAPAISAGVGTLVLLFVLGGFRELVPCIGWVPQSLVGIWGLGAVLMTRFGTQEYLGDQQPDGDGQPGPAAAVEIPESLPPAFPDAEIEDGAAAADEGTTDADVGADEESNGS